MTPVAARRIRCRFLGGTALAPPREPAPGYFDDVLATSINIMQDHITRTRLAGEPPHVMLIPRLRSIGLMEFNRAHERMDHKQDEQQPGAERTAGQAADG